LSPFNVAVAIAKIDSDVMDPRDVYNDELLVCPCGSGAGLAHGMPQLDYKPQNLEGTPNKKSAIPFLNPNVSFTSRNDRVSNY
jgi:hypothetical protein